MAAVDGRAAEAKSDLEAISKDAFRASDEALEEALGGLFERYGAFELEKQWAACSDTLRFSFSAWALKTAAALAWGHGNRNAPMFLGNYLDTFRHR